MDRIAVISLQRAAKQWMYMIRWCIMCTILLRPRCSASEVKLRIVLS